MQYISAVTKQSPEFMRTWE